MFLRKLALLNFKNHPQLNLDFEGKLTCIIGNNGTGKTNLLDAVYYLCLTKSYFNSVDQQNIRFGSDFFRLQGLFENEVKQHDVVYKLASGRKKELSVSDVPIPKLSEHIGKFPAVIISPDDSLLITGNSDERRRFLDSTLSQVNRQYLLWVIEYNKIVAQRNAALKRFAEAGTFNKALIESYNQQLVPLGDAIHQARKTAITKLIPSFNAFYRTISLEREQVSMRYVSQLNDKPFDVLLDETMQRDALLQRTEAGIHKDDIDFFIGENKLKKFGSQGQQKSFVIAAKFAQYAFIKEAKGFHPLLLIDDIFDKLDNDRSQRLIEMIAGDDFGQVFLTDTDDSHIKETLSGKENKYSVVKINYEKR
ncbi:MAG: DNA replication and repair protein RecF [Chitinophagales bacterium]|nr:DNA replication and repair protein RecF [Chitinophagales bacterium]